MSAIKSIRHALLARSPALMSAAKSLKRVIKPAKVKRADTSVTVATAASPQDTVTTARPVYPSSRAQRPIGILYDELSRGANPFSFIQSAGIADVTDPVEKIAEQFNRFGIVKVRRLHSAERSEELSQHCVNFSGLKPLDFRDVFSKKRNWKTGGAPALNDTNFWPYAADIKIQEIVEALIGDQTLEFGTSVAAHYSARGLHRDYRLLTESDASPYSAKNPQKQIIRIFHYCGASGGALGYIPFSHNEAKFKEQGNRVGLTRGTAWFDRHRDVLTQARLRKDFVEADEIERHICWLNADPGDVIISNSALLRCGEYLTGPRYVFVSTYAESNPETVALAANNAKSKTAFDYYRYMSEKGFKGSDDVLEAVGAL